MTTPAVATIVREYQPIDDRPIHGVTFDGTWVWFARDDELVAFDPSTAQVVRRFVVPGANAGTAFDGEHLYQLARGQILVIRPDDGRIVRTLPAPGKGRDSGMAYADGHLWVGQYDDARIHKIDARTGELVKTLSSDRFVTGVTCIDGALWHAASTDGKPSELRRLAADGAVEETVAVPVDVISGIEGVPGGELWCGGERGTLRRIRAPRGRAAR